MKLRLTFLASMTIALTLALVGVLRDATPTRAIMPLPVQPFAPQALGGISTTQLGQKINQNHTVTQVLAGERTSTPWIFSGPGFSVDLDKNIAAGTPVGTVWATIDVGCDGGTDYLYEVCPNDSAIPPVSPVPLTWKEATTVVQGTSDAFLITGMPPYSWLARHKADINKVCIERGGISVPSISVLNTVYATIPFSPNGGAGVASTILGGAPNGPPSSVCLDTPNTATSITSLVNNPLPQTDIDGPCNPAYNQCADVGIYGMWIDAAGQAMLTNVPVGPAGVTIPVHKQKVNNGPLPGLFREHWDAEVAQLPAPFITADWLSAGPELGPQCLNALDDDDDGAVNDGCPPLGAPEAGPQCLNAIDDDLPPDGVVNDGCPPVTTAFNADILLPPGVSVPQTENLKIVCNAPGEGLVVLKNVLWPIPPTEDTYLDDNAFTFVLRVLCNGVAGSPLVDKEVAIIKATPDHIAATSPIVVMVDELKENHATSDVLGNEWLVAEVSDVVEPLGVPDLDVQWAPAVIVEAKDKTTQAPTVHYCNPGAPNEYLCIRFQVNEWPGQADVQAQLNIACRMDTPPGLYAVVIKAIDAPAYPPYGESKASDNAQRKVISVWCGGEEPDGIDDATGLYPRWEIFQSMGQSQFGLTGDIRKPYQSPPSFPSDIGYVERTLQLECYWMDADGCYTDVGNTKPCDSPLASPPGNNNGYIEASESWNDYDLVQLGGYGVVDSDGDCLVDPAVPFAAQPGHPVDPWDDDPLGTLCPALQYSENPVVVQNHISADQDCDGLVDGIEKAFGSNPLVADSDADASADFVEMFMFTNPVNPDTDGDGFKDKPSNAYGDNTDPTMDNCPSVYNPTQLNSDGHRRPTGSRVPGVVEGGASNPSTDKMGDACDTDNDNDGATDGYELGWKGGGANATDPLVMDTDGDGITDGAEMFMVNGGDTLNFDPKNPAKKGLPTSFNSTVQAYYRGCHINVNDDPVTGYPAFAGYGVTNHVEYDQDGDGIVCPTDIDNDNGRGLGLGAATKKEVTDAVEAFGYNTALSRTDTDGDGCDDWVEIHDLNGDRKVSIGDLNALAKRGAGIIPGDDPVSEKIFDVNKDGKISIGDQNQIAQNSCGQKAWGGCPVCPVRP